MDDARMIFHSDLGRERSFSFIVPALNEALNLPGTISEIEAAAKACDLERFEIIVVNDGSSDDTVEVLDRIKLAKSFVRTVHHERSRGIGAAYKSGLLLAGCDYVMMVPGDNEHPSEGLIPIICAAGQSDVVLPFVSNAHVRPLGRRILSWAYVFFVNSFFRLKVPYYNGLVVHRRNIISNIDIETDGFGYQTEALIKLLKCGHSSISIPTQLRARAQGKSKAVSVGNAFDLLKLFMRLRLTIAGVMHAPTGRLIGEPRVRHLVSSHSPGGDLQLQESRSRLISMPISLGRQNKEFFWLLAKIVITVTFFGLVLWQIDLARLAIVIGRISPLVIMASLALLSISIVFNSFRWYLVGKVFYGPPSFLWSLSAHFIALLLNQAAPSTVAGDAARMLRLRAYNMDLGNALQSVAVDRISSSMGLLGLIIFSAAMIPSGNVAAQAIIGGATLLLIFLLLADRILALVEMKIITNIFTAARHVLLRSRFALAILLISIMAHVCSILVFVILSRGSGLNVPIVDIFIMASLVLLVVSVPVSIGGWGTREAAVAWLLALKGVPLEDGFAISIVYGLALTAVGLVGGGISLILLPRSNITSKQ